VVDIVLLFTQPRSSEVVDIVFQNNNQEVVFQKNHTTKWKIKNLDDQVRIFSFKESYEV
jgi:hypothetical protein